ncbi:MAG: hypothetical protein NC347_00380 [Clostridium sp.]|nr:hypothetical protein [Clostridium sp.]
MAGKVIEMPLRTNRTSKVQEAKQEYHETLASQLMAVAAQGDKNKILDFLEEQSEKYKGRKEFSMEEIEEIIDAYAYFCSYLDKATILERMERWDTDTCLFLSIADDITNAVYGELAKHIQSSVNIAQKEEIEKVVDKILGYVNADTDVTLSYFNKGVPSFQIVISKQTLTAEFRDEIITGIMYQFVTTGIIKGTVHAPNESKMFGIFINEDGMAGMTKEEIMEEFYVSGDGIRFKLEDNMEIIDVIGG